MSTDKYNELVRHSNPALVYRNLQKYLPGTKLYISTRKKSKYMVQKPDGTWSHFGDIRYEDFTLHKDIQRRESYLRRALNIKGNWRDDPYSSNMMAIMILWS